MPHVKPKTCHKCGQMYTGWRCPRCYRKHTAGRGSGGSSKHTFSASSVLGRGASMPIITTTDTSDHYNDPRNCRHCGYFTTTHPCTYCGKD